MPDLHPIEARASDVDATAVESLKRLTPNSRSEKRSICLAFDRIGDTKVYVVGRRSDSLFFEFATGTGGSHGFEANLRR